MSEITTLSEYIGHEVVIDLTAPFVCLGLLVAEDDKYFILNDADFHDLRDSSTTRELYILDSRRHGIGVNRERVLVPKHQVVGISKLVDVIG